MEVIVGTTSHKEVLLATTLDKLGVKGLVKKVDIKRAEKNGEKIPTLKQFVDGNNFSLLNLKDYFKVWSIPGDSQVWLDLKSFLTSSGFTVDDFIMLCLKAKGEDGLSRYDLSSLSKDQINRLTIGSIFHSSLISYINNVLYTMKNGHGSENNSVHYTVKELLSIFNLDRFIEVFEGKDYSTGPGFISKAKSLIGLQKALMSFGFNDEDGDFMKANLKVLAKGIIKRVEDHIREVEELMKCSHENAILTVNFALKMGWIEAIDYKST